MSFESSLSATQGTAVASVNRTTAEVYSVSENGGLAYGKLQPDVLVVLFVYTNDFAVAFLFQRSCRRLLHLSMAWNNYCRVLTVYRITYRMRNCIYVTPLTTFSFTFQNTSRSLL